MRVIARPSRLPAFAADPRPDAVLLARFTVSADEAAFAALVRRHTPLVRAVCGGWLRCAADVDDAAQATFLVLVRRADTLGGIAEVAMYFQMLSTAMEGTYTATDGEDELPKKKPLTTKK